MIENKANDAVRERDQVQDELRYLKEQVQAVQAKVETEKEEMLRSLASKEKSADAMKIELEKSRGNEANLMEAMERMKLELSNARENTEQSDFVTMELNCQIESLTSKNKFVL